MNWQQKFTDFLTGRAGMIAALICGILIGLTQAPFGVSLLLLPGIWLGFWLLYSAQNIRHAALLGWLAGVGYFAVLLHWIVEPFFVDASRHGWMAPFALTLMVGGMALFWAGSFALARLYRGTSLGLLLSFAISFSLFELLRAYLFTGFPWGMLSLALVGTPLGLLASTTGPYLLTFLTIFALGLFALPNWLRRSYQLLSLVMVGLVSFAWIKGVMVERNYRPSLEGQPIIRMVQPNIAQQDKWAPDKLQQNFNQLIDLSVKNITTNAGQPPDIIIWPEASIPAELGRDDALIAGIGERLGEVELIFGATRRDASGAYNSLAILGPDNRIAQIYDKHHLVPFGEYLPFAQWAQRLGLQALASLAPGGFAAGDGPAILPSGKAADFLPLICYEAIFSYSIPSDLQEAGWMVQITNDAWFGNFSGPFQHLSEARMRAIETGLPLVRIANTGISALILPTGRVGAQLPLNQAGMLDVPLPSPLPPTIYQQYREGIYALVVLIGLLLLYLAPILGRVERWVDRKF